MRVTAIDFETANASAASICSVGISVLQEGVIADEYYSLIRPEENVSHFNRMNIMVHGIRPADVREAPDFRQVYREILPYFEDTVVCAHNAGFDMGCLKAACINCGLPVPHLRYFDTVRLARKLFPRLEHHRLDDVCEHIGFELNHHNAASDAEGCLMIALQAMNLTGVYDIEEMLAQCGIRLYSL